MIALLASQAAFAVTNQYCFEYAVDFDDASVGNYLTGTTTKARGAQVRFVNNTTGATSYAQLDWDGPNPGCTTANLSNAVTWTIRVDRIAIVNGNTLVVKNAQGWLYSSTVNTNFVPAVGQDYNPTTAFWTLFGNSPSVRIMAVAQRAMQRRSGGLTGHTFEFRTDACNTGSSCYTSAGSKRIYIKPGHDLNKFTVAHEMGHAVMDAANGLNGFGDPFANGAYNADPGPCILGDTASHRINSKEYQTAAVLEGMANFYAAIAFNADSAPGADCDYATRNAVHWNANGDNGDDLFGEEWTCENLMNGAGPGGAHIPVVDYLGAFCSPGNNRATEFDWLRAMWDLTTDQGVSFASILSIWNVAAPHTWNPTGNGTGGLYPASMLSGAAASQGLGTTWDANASLNGTHR